MTRARFDVSVATARRASTAVLPLALLVLPVVLPGAACASEETAQRVAADRAALAAADPAFFHAVLGAWYARERACLGDRRFPAIVHLDATPDSVGVEYPVNARPYELLRAVGLVRREEVRRGDPDWSVSWGTDSSRAPRQVRYVLTSAALGDAVPDTTGGVMIGWRLCYARQRLASVDSLVKQAPDWNWSMNEGVRYGDAVVHVAHTVTLDRVAAWAHDVARRDSLQDVLHPDVLDGPQRRWAEFRRMDGEWRFSGTRRRGPR